MSYSPETKEFAEKALLDLSNEMLKFAEECSGEVADRNGKREGEFPKRLIAGLGMLAGGISLLADVMVHNPPPKK